MGNKMMSNSFDSEFDRIENLTWFPWVGKDYKSAPCKILIIGESQYATQEGGEFDKETAEAFLRNKETTREFAYNSIAKEEKPAKFYRNLLDTFLLDRNVEAFWNKVSFYHFFQRPDKAVSSNTHLKKEWLEAWSLWQKIIGVLHPDICIFCGVGLRRFYEEWNESIDKEANWYDIKVDFCKENRQPPIRGEFEITAADITQLLFINHPSSRGYSPECWREFLKRQLPEVMDWLNEE